MDGQWTLYYIPLLGSSLICFFMAYTAFRNRDQRGAKPLVGILFFGGFFNFSYALQLWHTTIGGSLFWSRMTMPGWTLAAVCIPLFVLEYTNREEWLRPSLVVALFSVPIVANILIWINHGWFGANPRMIEEASLTVLAVDNQPLWWFMIGYAYLLVLSGIALVAVQFIRSIHVGQFRGQSLTIIGALLLPVVANAIQNLLGLAVALASIGFALGGMLLFLTIFRYRLLRSVPVARRKVFQDMDEGFLVVDTQNRIIDANEQAREIFGGASLVDEDIEDVYPEYTTVLEEGGESASREYRRETDEGERIYDVDISTVHDTREQFDARVVLFHDITERKAYEQQLEEQRNNLEVLNQVVRHDIRNDLQLVSSYTEMLEPTGEDKAYVEKITEASNDAIDITMTARDVTEVMLQTDVDYHQVWLEAVLEDEIEDARANHDDAVVSVDGSLPSVAVVADDLLGSVFRNLLTNAVLHNDKDVPEVTVSTTRNDETVAVRIADNGPGIPDERKDEIFEQGEMGLDSEGTGLGLYLVETLVDRYGGEVHVEDNDPTGAVFVVALPVGKESVRDS